MDIYPTLAELAGLAVPESVQGDSLLPLLGDPTTPGKKVVFSTMVSTHTRLIGRSVRTERFRYIEWDEGRGGCQLYDHARDPQELANLADEPAHAALIQQFHRRLASHTKARSGD